MTVTPLAWRSTDAAAPARRFDLDAVGARQLAYRLLCVFWFTIPWEGVIRIHGTTTIARAAGVVTAGVAAVVLIKSGRRHRLNEVVILTCVFTGWVALSSFWTISSTLTTERIITTAQLAVMVALTWEFAHTRKQVMGLMSAWVAGSVVLASIVIVTFANNGSSTRYTAPGTDAGDLSFTVVLAIPMAWYLSIRATRSSLALLYRLFLPYAVIAVILTATRAASLTAGVSLLIIPMTWRGTSVRARLLLIAAVVGAAVAVPLAIHDAAGPIKRLSTTQSEITTGTLDQRTTLWSIGIDEFNQHPILGVGSGSSRIVVAGQFSSDKGLHNTFLSIAVELGTVGLILFLLICLAAIKPAVRSSGWLERRLAWVLAIVFVISLVPRHVDYTKSTWAILTLFSLIGTVLARPSSS